MDPSNIIMPWGKYEGRAIDELPSNYLHWILDNFDTETRLKQSIVDAAEEELEWRDDNGGHFKEYD